ncbi:hypothetical protein PHLGIDRAFT_200365 [Phlebiopsis gigantea 11061_1 CR5-6]|uniref:FHA domain-containing protein n=1 Tax=Phlebiopsis gigantea (strain 11061_1 CR5-6) TaxID=745531 RepID=A0A0C3PFI3_PHLG1|nr:hypothetical protein PHLGIDRAFT_200365 [Phlebiopsis gigantea 11061_1 CR5-6]
MARTNLLQEPPKPRQLQAVSTQACPYATPPSSPRLCPVVSTPKFKHFGVLQPVSEGPAAKSAYYFRPEHLEHGLVNPVDYEFHFGFDHVRWTWPVKQYCNIYLGDSSSMVNESIKIVAQHDEVRVNGEHLERDQIYDLRHGDQIQFGSRALRRSNPDCAMRFVWLQCSRGGWLPLDYEIDDPAEDPSLWPGYDTPPAPSYIELA